ncbi:MAG: flagellar hook-length control protein FliK [Gemmatimonadota bacterium]
MVSAGNVLITSGPQGTAATGERRFPTGSGALAERAAIRRTGFQEALQQVRERRSRGPAAAELEAAGQEERPETQPPAAREEGAGPEEAEDRERAGGEGPGKPEKVDRAAKRGSGEDGDAAPAAPDEKAQEAGVAPSGTEVSAGALVQVVATVPVVEAAGEEAEGQKVDGAGGSSWARLAERLGDPALELEDGEGLDLETLVGRLEDAPGGGESREAANPFDLLKVHEVMDPDVHVDAAPDQLLERLQQAMEAAPGPRLPQEVGQAVLPQVVRNLVALVRDGVSEMRLQLQPADLGHIELRVRSMEGIVHGELTVQNPEVKHLLESQLQRLRAALSEQGLQLQGFDVSVASDGRFARSGSDQHDTDDPGRTPWRARPAQGAVAAPVEAPAPRAASLDLGDHAVNYVA